MITQSALSLKSPVDVLGNKIRDKVRISLRQLSALHVYRHKGKLYTYDVPFKLMISKDGNNIFASHLTVWCHR
jgi:hypothetical protein